MTPWEIALNNLWGAASPQAHTPRARYRNNIDGETRICAKCGPRPISEFRTSKRKGKSYLTYSSYCVDCHREYMRKWTADKIAIKKEMEHEDES